MQTGPEIFPFKQHYLRRKLCLGRHLLVLLLIDILATRLVRKAILFEQPDRLYLTFTTWFSCQKKVDDGRTAR